MDVEQVTFQAQAAHKAEDAVRTVGQTTEDAVQQQHGRHREGDVKHALNVQRKQPMTLLF